MLVCAGRPLQTTNEGFLTHADEWNEEVAEALAEAHGFELEPEHWQILQILRGYCAEGNEPPSMRKLSRLLKDKVGPQISGSIYLMKLFGPSPAKMAARIAGLPKPKNCF